MKSHQLNLFCGKFLLFGTTVHELGSTLSLYKNSLKDMTDFWTKNMAGEGCDRSDKHLFAMTWKVFSLEILNSSTNLKEINKLLRKSWI